LFPDFEVEEVVVTFEEVVYFTCVSLFLNKKSNPLGSPYNGRLLK
jgi:hypothetical protein